MGEKGYIYGASKVAQWVKNLPEMQEMQADASSIPRLRRSPGEAHGNPLQYSCLQNSMDRGAWLATVHRVTESDMTEATKHSTEHACVCASESLCCSPRAFTTLFANQLYPSTK